MFGADGRALHRPPAISVAGLMLAGVGLAVTALVLAGRVTDRQHATAIERAVVGLEKLDDVADLVDVLAASATGALD